MALLGVHDPAIFEDWTTRVQAHEAIAIPVDVIVRIGCVLSIYGSLRALFPEERAAEWLRAPTADRIFRGRNALALMTGGPLEGPIGRASGREKVSQYG